MRALPNGLRRQLESAVLAGRGVAEAGVRAALSSLGVAERDKPGHLNEVQGRLRRGLRAKQRQLGGEFEVLVWDAAYEQWHRLLFARFLAENGLLRHPQFGAPVTLAECEELAEDLGEPDGWSVAARFAAEILPGIFRLDDPCVQLRLAPEHRVGLEKIVAGLPVEVFVADDSLGWVYQYWQSERKDQVNASEVKIGGADLGPVTQLFTENYMVRFLLENSLGAWWAARRPGSPLVKEFEFLRFDDDGQPAAGSFDGWPGTVAEVTVMDPCCGSGHFLVEAFGMLWRMRAEEEGLDSVAAQDAVLRDNLFGLELDPRCVQIAMFAVALTAWKQGGGWRELPTPNIACSGIPAKAPLEEWTALADGDERLVQALERLHTLFKDADTLGSLIDPRRATEMANASGLQKTVWDVDFEEVAPLLEKAAARETDDPATAVLGADAAGIARAATLLSRTFTVIATNVPFLSSGKQVVALRDHLDRHFASARGDLATAMISRSQLMAGRGTVAVVSPDKWLYLGSYRDFRVAQLRRYRWNVIGVLGPKGFSTPMFDLGVVLIVLSRTERPGVVRIGAAEEGQTPPDKARLLREAPLAEVSAEALLANPDARFSQKNLDYDRHPLLAEYVTLRQGLSTGDYPRFIHSYWEQSGLDDRWVPFRVAVSRNGLWLGCHDALRWEGGRGALHDFAERNRETRGSRHLQGQDVWGESGVLVSQMSLAATLYHGSHYADTATVMVPKDPSLLPALWCYLSSRDYEETLRAIDYSLKIPAATLAKVPFDVDRWRAVAAEEFPEGLPEPWSDDPTQWLFGGRPEVATEPLQVGVGRLVGYRWPEQSQADDLDEFADRDGIVCLPAVGGELPAADRLAALLSAAFGEEWSPALVRRVLEEAGSANKSLGDWLRDEFFKHHCKVFSNRPFVWHVWDGRKDGFSALVNYHRLDRAGLEKLTYTYLGDWIERQRADAAEDVAGADVRLGAARELKGKLEAILEGEPPYDIYVRWKELHEQPIGWDPDLDDGVRLNIRPFVEAGVLRAKVNVHWKKDRGKNPDGSERHNDLHYTNHQKREARQKAGNA